MRYTTIGSDPATARNVSVLALGAMRFGTTTDDATSYAILDRFAEAGGSFIDTSNNYAYWVNGTQGGESEALLGRWRRARGIGEEMVIATKVGGRPTTPTNGPTDRAEGLAPEVLREQAERSRERLDEAYDHPGTPRRLAALAGVANETGATRNQIVLAWMLGGALPVVPLVGVSSLAQLEEALAAVDLELRGDQRRRLDEAH